MAVVIEDVVVILAHLHPRTCSRHRPPPGIATPRVLHSIDFTKTAELNVVFVYSSSAVRNDLNIVLLHSFDQSRLVGGPVRGDRFGSLEKNVVPHIEFGWVCHGRWAKWTAGNVSTEVCVERTTHTYREAHN